MQSWDNRKPASEDRKKQEGVRENNQINVVMMPLARLPVYINA